MRGTFLTLAAIVAVDSLSYALVLPLLPFVVREQGGGVAATAAVFAAFSIAQLVAAPLLGRASDRWGRRPVLLVSQLGTALGFVLLGLARGLPLLLAARVLDGATSGSLTVVTATVCDLEIDARSSARVSIDRFAAIHGASGAGLLVGLLLCGLLSPAGLPRLALAALLAALATLVASALVPLPRRARDAAPAARLTLARLAAPVRRAAAVLVCGQVILSAFATGLPLVLHACLGLSEQAALLAGAASLALGGGAQALASPLLRRLDERTQAALAFAVTATGMAALLVACLGGGRALAALGALLATAGLLRALAAATAALGRADVTLGTGSLMGLAQSMGSIGQLVGPVLGYAALGLHPSAWCGLLVTVGVVGGAGSLTWLPTTGDDA